MPLKLEGREVVWTRDEGPVEWILFYRDGQGPPLAAVSSEVLSRPAKGGMVRVTSWRARCSLSRPGGSQSTSHDLGTFGTEADAKEAAQKALGVVSA
jgi:hypothetical protein